MKSIRKTRTRSWLRIWTKKRPNLDDDVLGAPQRTWTGSSTYGPGRCRTSRSPSGHVEGVRKLDRTPTPQVQIIFGQVPCPAVSFRRTGSSPAPGIQTVSDKEKTFIKGQRYRSCRIKPISIWTGRRSLKLLLKANKRISKAYLLKEAFGQLWVTRIPSGPGILRQLEGSTQMDRLDRTRSSRP